eukprot:3300798-Amphidinium_carterae.1
MITLMTMVVVLMEQLGVKIQRTHFPREWFALLEVFKGRLFLEGCHTGDSLPKDDAFWKRTVYHG